MGSNPRPQDFASRFIDLERRVATMERASRLNSASIGSGGLTIRRGGNLVFEDGGGIEVNDGGNIEIVGGGFLHVVDGGGIHLENSDMGVTDGGLIIVEDGGGIYVDSGGGISVRSPGALNLYRNAGQGSTIQGFWGQVPPPTGVSEAVYALEFIDISGNSRVVMGDIVSFPSSGPPFVSAGILTQDSNNVDLFYTDEHNFEAFVGGSYADFGLLFTQDWPDDFDFYNTVNNYPGLTIRLTSGGCVFLGGDDGSGYADQLIMHPSFEIRCMDGAGSSYIPIAASNFITRTSSESTKNIVGLLDSGARETVRGVPVKRWTYKTPMSRDSSPVKSKKDRRGSEKPKDVDHSTAARGSVTPSVEHLGPVVEDCPNSLIAKDADGHDGVDIAASLWTLWAAVQEQDTVIEDLKTQVADLTATVNLLKGQDNG